MVMDERAFNDGGFHPQAPSPLTTEIVQGRMFIVAGVVLEGMGGRRVEDAVLVGLLPSLLASAGSWSAGLSSVCSSRSGQGRGSA